MQTIPNRPIPYEPFDSYAHKLFKRKAKTTIHTPTSSIEAEKWLIAYQLILIAVCVYIKLW